MFVKVTITASSLYNNTCVVAMFIGFDDAFTKENKSADAQNIIFDLYFFSTARQSCRICSKAISCDTIFDLNFTFWGFLMNA